MALTILPDGEIGTIVTYLEMNRAAAAAANASGSVPPEALGRSRAGQISAAVRTGRARWLWYSRLAMDDAALGKAIGEVACRASTRAASKSA